MKEGGGSICPHCGQWPGNTDRCAHCGIRFKKIPKAKLLRGLVLVVIIGIAFLFHIQRSSRPPRRVKIGEIRPAMNLAHVSVQGVLADDARELKSGSFLYRIDDGTGILSVFIQRKPEGALPQAGRYVAASGSLSIGADQDVRMRAQSVAYIAIEISDFNSDGRLADISAEDQGSRMTVYGAVVKVWRPDPGSKAPSKITLADSSGTLEVVHWFEPERLVGIGDTLAVFGTVDVYRGRLQLKVWEADDIQSAGQASGSAGP